MFYRAANAARNLHPAVGTLLFSTVTVGAHHPANLLLYVREIGYVNLQNKKALSLSRCMLFLGK